MNKERIVESNIEAAIVGNTVLCAAFAWMVGKIDKDYKHRIELLEQKCK